MADPTGTTINIGPLIFILGIFIFGIYALVKGLHARKRYGDNDGNGAYCGHCHYDVRGVSSFECPECGSDLREVGILRDVKNKGGIWFILGIVLLSFLFLLCLLFTIPSGPNKQPKPRIIAPSSTPPANTVP